MTPLSPHALLRVNADRVTAVLARIADLDQNESKRPQDPIYKVQAWVRDDDVDILFELGIHRSHFDIINSFGYLASRWSEGGALWIDKHYFEQSAEVREVMGTHRTNTARGYLALSSAGRDALLAWYNRIH